jgi:hypothetical protein
MFVVQIRAHIGIRTFKEVVWIFSISCLATNHEKRLLELPARFQNLASLERIVQVVKTKVVRLTFENNSHT